MNPTELIARLAEAGAALSDAGKEKLREAMTLLEAEMSHNETDRLLRKAISAKYPTRWTWIMDVYQDHLIFQDEGPRKRDGLTEETTVTKLYWVDYTISDTGEVTLGDPIEVRIARQYVPVGQTPEETSESAGAPFEGDVVPLTEKAVRRDGTIPIKVIAPGWGSSGYYSPAMLERDGPKVFKAGLHMYWDHPTASETVERPERSLRDLAATLTSDARYEANGPAGPGLYADALVREDFRAPVEELAPHIGVSIRAYGKAKQGEAEGRKGPLIEELTSSESVDFVTKPGAGGRVLELFESAGRRQAAPVAPAPVVEQEAEDTLKEAEVKETEELRQENARLREALILTEAKGVCTRTLAAIEMPALTRARLQAVLETAPVVKEGALDEAAYVAAIQEAAKAELAYIAQLTGSGKVVGLGESAADTNGDEGKAVSEAEAVLTDAFSRMGMSESGVKVAVGGR